MAVPVGLGSSQGLSLGPTGAHHTKESKRLSKLHCRRHACCYTLYQVCPPPPVSPPWLAVILLHVYTALADDSIVSSAPCKHVCLWVLDPPGSSASAVLRGRNSLEVDFLLVCVSRVGCI